MRQNPFLFESDESQFEDSFEYDENEDAGSGSGEYENEYEGAQDEGEIYRGRGKQLPARRQATRPRAAVRPRVRRRYPYPRFSGYVTAIDPSPGGSELVRVLQSLLNRVLGLNLPVDGVLSVETRSAIRSFRNGQNAPAQNAPAGDHPPSGGAPVEDAAPAGNDAAPAADDPSKPQPEYGEFDYFGFEDEDENEWNREYFELESSPSQSLAAPSVQALRDNMVRIAQAEWRRWGNGTLRETDPRMRGVLADYWKTGTGQARTEAGWWSATPWSAAFISWVVKKAGGGGAFSYSAAHANYIRAAKENRRTNNGNPFRAYRIDEISPQPGDLVCACRDTCRANFDSVAAGMPTHCDIVTEKHPGYIVTIGGNVGNTVGRKTVPVDERGFLKASNPKTSKYFAVIRAEQRGAGTPTSYQPSAAKPAPSGAPDIVTVRGIQVARQIAPQVEALLAAAEREGVKLTGGGYRSSDQQIKLRIAHCGGNTPYNIYEKPSSQCTPPTAPPGRSNHEKGLAIDFKYNGQGIKTRSNPGFVWLARNAAKYGLYNLPSEPWHWSINGK